MVIFLTVLLIFTSTFIGGNAKISDGNKTLFFIVTGVILLLSCLLGWLMS